MTGVPSVTGNRSRYSSMTPRQVMRSILAFDPHHARHCANDIQLAQIVDGGGKGGVGRSVADEYEARVVAAAVLPDVGDADVVVAERLSHPGEDTRLIDHIETDVVAGERFTHRQHRQPGVRGLSGATGAPQLVARDGDEVAEHRACR